VHLPGGTRTGYATSDPGNGGFAIVRVALDPRSTS
jgi:hypothetical protein